jgi:hypothetical protein
MRPRGTGQSLSRLAYESSDIAEDDRRRVIDLVKAIYETRPNLATAPVTGIAATRPPSHLLNSVPIRPGQV